MLGKNNRKINKMKKLKTIVTLDKNKLNQITEVDKYGYHTKALFKEGENVLYFGEPAKILKVRLSKRVSYDVSYTEKSGFQCFVYNKANQIKKLKK
tara:strand:+ start:4951 stop:5238 length:288 start_codon:yes stop_codon:yes gene_type:complete